MSVRARLETAFLQALAAQQELHEKWVRVSFQLGRGSNPYQMMFMQPDGRMDLLLRAVEAETLAAMSRPQEDEPNFSLEIQYTLSRYWILSMYELLRSSNRESEEIKALHRRFELIRIPLAKFQIAQDRHKPTIFLGRYGDGPEQEADAYSWKDGRVPYMPRQVVCNQTGSIAWLPVDYETQSEVFISRRMLSDEVLRIFN